MESNHEPRNGVNHETQPPEVNPREAPDNTLSCDCEKNSCDDSAHGIARRQLLKGVGLGLVAGALGAKSLAPVASPFAAADIRSGHLIPENKMLSEEWLRSLYTRGKKEVFTGESLNNIGMPCGGIGAGQLYLCGDGTLGCWQIFNNAASNWNLQTFTTYTHRGVEKPMDQGFAVVIEPPSGPADVKTLSREGFEEVTFMGEYPIGTVRYAESGCPVKIEMEAFSPFIPLNASDSSLPATLFHITVENISSAPLCAGVLGWLQNAVCKLYAQEYDATRKTEYRQENGYTLCLHSATHGARKTSEQQSERWRRPIVFEDFEGDDYGAWKVTGNAFGAGPATASTRRSRVTGYKGDGFASSSVDGDGRQGTLTSPSFIISRRYINFLMSGGKHPGRVFIRLEVDGEAVRTSLGQNTDAMKWHSWSVSRWEGREARIIISDQMGFPGGQGRIAVDHIEFADAARAEDAPITQAPDYGTMALACAEVAGRNAISADMFPPDHSSEQFVLDALTEYSTRDMRLGLLRTGAVKLAPGEKHTFTFALAWHFPNQYNGDVFAVTPWTVAHGAVGHYYDNQFPNAAAVIEYIFQNHARLAGETRLWRDCYYDSSLPYWLLDRLHSTVSCLASGTSQWWKDGRFWAYEGVSCCWGTCTHVWNYAHAHARLFPELARSTREMQDFLPREQGGGFHPSSGLVGFRGDNRYAADGQCGTILKAWREHLMSRDNTFLKRNWPAIKQALQYLIGRDGNKDGLIENMQHNTYDIDYFGANSFVGALYLAALRAGEEMAMEMDDWGFARKARAIFESGAALTEKRLWNGEYYIQDVDLERYPRYQYKDGCLSDQLFGQGWAHQTGLGYLYSRERIVKTLQSIWKYNWAPDIAVYNEVHPPFRWFVSPGEAGLITCTWPKSEHMKEGTRYAEEVWTGIEYQVAGHMIWEGLVQEGLAICRAVHDRYHPDRFNPYNEIECGDHYARAMASWGVYLALAGYTCHGPKGLLGFAPRVHPERFKAVVTTAEGWMVFEQTRDGNSQKNILTAPWGRVRLSRLSLEAGCAVHTAIAKVQGRVVETTVHTDENLATLEFAEELLLNTGDSLEVLLT